MRERKGSKAIGKRKVQDYTIRNRERATDGTGLGFCKEGTRDLDGKQSGNRKIQELWLV